MFDKAVAVYKYNNKALEFRNIIDEIGFITFDMQSGEANPAEVFYDLLDDIVKVPMSYLKEWGDLPKTRSGQMQKLNFEGDFDAFISFLESKYFNIYLRNNMLSY